MGAPQLNILGWLKNKLLTGSSSRERVVEDQVLYNTHPRCESGFGVEQLATYFKPNGGDQFYVTF